MATRDEDPGITPEQLLEIETRHRQEWPQLGYFEPGKSNQDIQKLIEVIRKLTGWPKHDAKLFERRLGKAAAAAAPQGRKKP